MTLITSTENPIYKKIFQLKMKKNRDKMGKYIIEGPNLIAEALDNQGEIEVILRTPDFNLQEYDLKGRKIPVYTMESGLFGKLSDTETPQGVMAVVKKRIYSEQEFFLDQGSKSNIILLDRLQDPGNIGTILRTADAAGYLGAILMKGSGDIYSPKVVRSAAGSLFRLPVLILDTPAEALSLLRKYGKRILCTALKEAKIYYDADLRENAAIIIGNEGNGVCREFLEGADSRVKIPMEGTIESLNAAVSAGIFMYESVRQNFRQ